MTWRPALALIAVLVSGCADTRLYTWGHYEELVYTSYAAPDKLPPAKQIEDMEADYQKARSQNKPVHPGFHAHLGYLYFQIGKLDQARQEFNTEKAQFPESAVFMDRLLANLEKQ